MNTYEDHERASLEFFAKGLPDVLPDIPDPGFPPCPICSCPLDMTDLASGELGFGCSICGIEWCKMGCHGQLSEDCDDAVWVETGDYSSA